MKKAIHLLLTICLASVLLAGCSGNLFMQFDQVEVKSVSEIGAVDASSPSASSAFLTDVEDWLEHNALSGESASSTAVADKLDEIAALGSVDDATLQKASMLAGIVRVDSDENAVELINNLAETLATLSDDASTATAEEIIRDMIPESVLNDRLAFESMIATMQTSAASFNTFGGSLTSDYTDLSSGEKGDVAQYAAVSIVIDLAVTNLSGGVDDLWVLATGTGTPSFLSDPIDELESSGSTNLYDILTWAGYDSFF